MKTANQNSLVLQAPYGTTFVNHLHHVELLYAKRDIGKVLEWLQNLNTVLISQYTETVVETSEKCKHCKNGYILDTNRTNEVFPDGIPIKCPDCNGTTMVIKNDIIEEPPKTFPCNAPVHVVSDDGIDDVMTPEQYEI